MSLLISYKSKAGVTYEAEWHLGEPIPLLQSGVQDVPRVVTFQADGDELTMIFDAMEHPVKL